MVCSFWLDTKMNLKIRALTRDKYFLWVGTINKCRNCVARYSQNDQYMKNISQKTLKRVWVF